MRWWGWGVDAHAPALPAHALRFLRDTVGVAPRPRPPVALANVRLAPARLPDGARAALEDVVGAANVSDDHRERVLHAAGKGYPDLVRMRAGEPLGAPDAVVRPTGHDQLRALLELCARSSVAVVPFGGGTSVVGGVEPLRGEHDAVIALDMGRMGSVLGIDGESSTVTVQAGMRAPALERHLAARGLTLGHHPQSFEHVSLGGCAATRSAGQASTGYGAIDKMVVGLRLASPAREIDLAAMPATAAGPGMRQLLIGSEGVFGVIGELALRVRPAPQLSLYEGVFFEDFTAGEQALRALAREHALPDVARLSDEEETRMSLALAGQGGVKGLIGGAYLRARGYAGGCLSILGFEGGEREVALRRSRALELVRGRFAAPYLRDDLLTHGVMVETLETATQWANVITLRGKVARAIALALRRQGTPGLVMCHISHVYETGASLYFTLLARQREGAEIEQWEAVKLAAGDAVVAGGGTITHHHAIGRDHARWLGEEIGEGGIDALRAVKAQLDPAGVMNPGKLILRA